MLSPDTGGAAREDNATHPIVLVLVGLALDCPVGSQPGSIHPFNAPAVEHSQKHRAQHRIHQQANLVHHVHVSRTNISTKKNAHIVGAPTLKSGLRRKSEAGRLRR